MHPCSSLSFPDGARSSFSMGNYDRLPANEGREEGQRLRRARWLASHTRVPNTSSIAPTVASTARYRRKVSGLTAFFSRSCWRCSCPQQAHQLRVRHHDLVNHVLGLVVI